MTKHLSLLAAALAAGTLLAAVPASAQQAAAPVTTASPVMTVPMTMGTSPLVIPPPPGGKLRVEMDARSEDLLGMMKSFLKGIGETGQPVYPASGRAMSPSNPVADAIANGDLAAMLKDVNHVHIAVYEVAGPAPMPLLGLVPPGTIGLKKMLAAPTITPASPVIPAFDSNSFYESAFAAEGAHRLLYADADAYKLVMVGFPNRQGFAFAASGGGYVFVERSDGYPDLEILTAFISHVTTAVVNSQIGKKMMNSAVGGTTLTMPAANMLDKK